jgi:hypothetical protein
MQMLAINVFRDTPMVYFVTEKQIGWDRFERLRPIQIYAHVYSLLHASQDGDYASNTTSMTKRQSSSCESHGSPTVVAWSLWLLFCEKSDIGMRMKRNQSARFAQN